MGDLADSLWADKMNVMETAVDCYRSTSHCRGVLEQLDFAAWLMDEAYSPFGALFSASRCNLEPRQFL
jgi:hypothetical protein